METAVNEPSKNRSLEDVNWLNSTNVATKVEEPKQSSKSESNNALANLSGISVDETSNDDSILQPTVTLTAKTAQYTDAFSDLDPLGTGKIRPYIDKKYFFQELKNPPKKVLKELSDRDGTFSAIFSANGSVTADVLAAFDDSCMQPSNAGSRKNSDQNESSINSNEFVAQFASSTQIFSPNNNGTHGTPPQMLRSANEMFKLDPTTNKTEDPIIGSNRTLLVTDSDPFSPRMKKFDPFEDDFSKKPIGTFEFGFSKGKKSSILPDTRIGNEEKSKSSDEGVFNGPLQVSLPPEGNSTYVSSRRIEKQASEQASDSTLRSRPNVIKQNTVDALSSISTKKIKPHIFSQKLTKRDSNMRRLQESDSFSENETAPEPPPRPDTNTYSEPPPLPPKKQFSDIVIRPRVTSPLAMSRDSAKYDYLSATRQNHSSYDQQSAENTPSIPLPSRRIGRTESSYPGPGRPEKKREDDYLTPITTKGDLPILLPPPKTRGSIKNRSRRSENVAQSLSDTSKKVTGESDIENANQCSLTKAIPDITLSQLLTLGIDDLASKLNVPSSKLNTMTIVELTKYLSDYIEKSSQKSIPAASEPTLDTVPYTTAAPAPTSNLVHAPSTISTKTATSSAAPPLKTATESAVFKVSFDDSNDQTFIAKFDDNFGIDNDFIPNFDHFNQTHNSTVDKYAVFREIIDQELQSDAPQALLDTKPSDGSAEASSDGESPVNEKENVTTLPKIDTKITQAISHAKDRYAALRDIILVEDLFEKPTAINASPLEISTEQAVENVDNSLNEDIEKEFDEAGHSSPDVNISINLEDHDDTDPLKTITTPTISQPILGSKDDLEIDEYMNRAISNLSLDSRDHLSPLSKSPANKSQNASTSPLQQKSSPLIDDKLHPDQKTSLNDMSTSPIPMQSVSPIAKQVILESPASTGMVALKSPMSLASDDKSPSKISISPTAQIIPSQPEQKPAPEQNNGE